MPEPQFDSHRQIATPQSKPQVGGDYTYFKDDDGFYGMKSDGTEFLIGPGSGGGGGDPSLASRLTVYRHIVAADYAGLGITDGSSGSFNILSWDGFDDPQVGTAITLNTPDDGNFNINAPGFYSISVWLKPDNITAARATMDLRARTRVASPYGTLFDCNARGGDADTGQSFPSSSRTYFHPGGTNDIYCTVVWEDFDATTVTGFIVEISIQELPGGPGPKGDTGPEGTGADSVPVGTTGYSVVTATVGGHSGVRAYASTNPDAVVWAAMANPTDAHPSQVMFADPFAGWYLSNGLIDPITGVNLFLWDNHTLALSGSLRIANGPLNMIGEPVFWNADDRNASSSIGDFATDGTAPSLVGVKGWTTAARNALHIAGPGDHYMVFDTNLGKPIWSDGAGGWVDATGASV